MSREGDSDKRVLFCSICDEEEEHTVLREKKVGDGYDLLLKCGLCGNVCTAEIRPNKIVRIPMTLSDGKISFFEEIESDDDEVIVLGDKFEHTDSHWEVTRIEDETGRAKRSMLAHEIKRGWATRVDRVIIHLTLTDGEHSTSSSIECTPDTIFQCESLIEVEGRVWMIRAIHTGKGRTLGGRRAAEDIRRMYLHAQ